MLGIVGGESGGDCLKCGADAGGMVDASKNPIHITGMKYSITISDNQVVWGCRSFTFDEVKALDLKDCRTSWDSNEFKLNKKIITESIRYYRGET